MGETILPKTLNVENQCTEWIHTSSNPTPSTHAPQGLA